MLRAAVITAVLLTGIVRPAAPTDHAMTLTGNFMSGFQDRVKPLRAVFTHARETATDQDQVARFDVVFYFRFNGRNHEYRGTAEGRLGPDGELAGRVQNESRQRTFTFQGEFRNGVLEGTHFEIGRRGERKTGTLMLEIAGS